MYTCVVYLKEDGSDNLAILENWTVIKGSGSSLMEICITSSWGILMVMYNNFLPSEPSYLCSTLEYVPPHN